MTCAVRAVAPNGKLAGTSPRAEGASRCLGTQRWLAQKRCERAGLQSSAPPELSCIRKPPFASGSLIGAVSGSRFAPRSFIGAERVCSSYKLGPPVTRAALNRNVFTSRQKPCLGEKSRLNRESEATTYKERSKRDSSRKSGAQNDGERRETGGKRVGTLRRNWTRRESPRLAENRSLRDDSVKQKQRQDGGLKARRYVRRDASREVQRHGEARDKKSLFAPLIP